MKYLICNLKAHKDYNEIKSYLNNIKNIKANNNLIMAPSNIYLSLFKDLNFLLATQNLDLYADKRLTGDTNIEALIDLGVKYVIIGHYDRKEYYKEEESEIIKKINLALKYNLKVIYCIGETEIEKARKVEFQVLEKSIARVLNNIPINRFKDVIIAYEPTYMIGGRETLDFSLIKEKITFIKDLITNYYNEDIKVIYGGNINSKNIMPFLSLKNLDGFIIGNSCLDPNELKNIIKLMNI